ncbi:TlpA disulfide reductase family protein [Pedobacter nyackensis]|uniref:Thiol-disulfide isomerase or thioredoxin n=1 Tax=Pedobacter nyackensis TaxID=475255 RepID=A0A1W2CSB8_9SPHI|nr:TlpA disulfide reductase family protein [Pedobacter nyackensis]SMC88127.1 Thiol-disulfide isomerase or thioredoxin [Pedobacter nyackensis]
MKQILRQLLIIVCGWMFSCPAFASNDIKTIVKGSIQGIDIKHITIFNRESVRGSRVTDSINSNGQFQFNLNVKVPGFYVVSMGEDEPTEFEMYLNPGDQLSLKIAKDQVFMIGKGSVLNQFLYDMATKFKYNPLDLASHLETYNNQVNAINSSTNAEVVRRKALLLGNAQGVFLDQTFGPLLESKAHGADGKMMQVNFSDLNILLIPEIMVHPNWRLNITELMFAKMKAGQLKINHAHSWVADFGKAIENQKLREAYITATLTYAASIGDLVAVPKEINAVLPLVKNPVSVAKINGLKAKINQGLNFYKNAPLGTDMSAYAFQNAKDELVSIKDYKGKLIYVDIWNTGCKPCIAEMPYLKQLEQDLHGEDIVFLSVSCDYDLAMWKRFLQKHNMTGEQLIMMGKKDTFFDKIGKGGVPRFVILDKQGKMLDYNSCKRPSNPILKIYLTELLNQSKL